MGNFLLVHEDQNPRSDSVRAGVKDLTELAAILL